MTKDEAIAWAAKNIAEALGYEYYKDKPTAEYAAKAITLLSGNQWIVKEGNEGRLWVIRA